MISTEFVISFIVLLVAMGLTYVIQYESVISPGYISFDDRDRNELKIMYIYNRLMNIGFSVYVILAYSVAIVAYVKNDLSYLQTTLYIQFIYFIINLSVMIIMYYRSYLYWERKSF